MLATGPVEASVEESVATELAVGMVAANCGRKLSVGHPDNTNDDDDDYDAEDETGEQNQLGNEQQSFTKRRSSVQSQHVAGIRRSSRDATASPKAKGRVSITDATPSPKEKRRSLQQSSPVVEGDVDLQKQCNIDG